MQASDRTFQYDSPAIHTNQTFLTAITFQLSFVFDSICKFTTSDREKKEEGMDLKNQFKKAPPFIRRKTQEGLLHLGEVHVSILHPPHAITKTKHHHAPEKVQLQYENH